MQNAKIAWAVMENHGYKEVFDLKSHAYLRSHPNCIWYSNYFATNHPSGPNYRVMAAGDKVVDTETYEKPFPCLASELGKENKESTVINLKGIIALRHNPYEDMQVPRINNLLLDKTSVFNSAIIDNANNIYDHVYFGWDDLNNAHSGTLDVADKNLSDLIQAIELSQWFAQGNIFLFTWDESFDTSDLTQHVACFAFSKQFTNKEDTRQLNHFNFCKTMYNNYGLDNSYLKGITETLY